MTNTKVKFLLVVEEHTDAKSMDVREAFRKLHLAYVDAISNPFHVQGHALMSPGFEGYVRHIIMETNRS